MLYDVSNSNNRSLAMGCEIEYAVRMEPVHELSTAVSALLLDAVFAAVSSNDDLHIFWPPTLCSYRRSMAPLRFIEAFMFLIMVVTLSVFNVLVLCPNVDMFRCDMPFL